MLWRWALVLLVTVACGSGAVVPRQPEGSPPTRKSVTRAHPGGDAADPHAAALQRLLAGPWGARNDRDQQLLVALPDADNWKRIRYWGVEHFVGFRYGEERHAFVAVFVQDSDEERPSSEACLRRFEKWGRPQIQAFDVAFEPFRVRHAKFRARPLVGLDADGEFNFGFTRTEFSAAWAAYAIYPHACLISAIVVPWKDNQELARRVRDRFMEEGFAQLKPLTETRPYRKAR